MKKLKKFVKKNQVLLIAVCVCIAALTATFFAGGNLSDSKVQTASTASSISTTSADTETTSVSATEKITQSPTDSTKSNKDNKDKKDEKDNKNSEDKKNSKVSSQNSSSSSVEKSEKTEQVSGNSTSDKKKPSSSSNSSSKPNKKNDVQPTTQDKYKTDPVPSGKPKPVEPQEQETKDTNLYCTFTITCSTILNNMDDLDPEKIELVPKDGIIFKKQKIQFKEGESVLMFSKGFVWITIFIWNQAGLLCIIPLILKELTTSTNLTAVLFRAGCTKSTNGFQTTAVHDMS